MQWFGLEQIGITFLIEGYLSKLLEEVNESKNILQLLTSNLLPFQHYFETTTSKKVAVSSP